MKKVLMKTSVVGERFSYRSGQVATLDDKMAEAFLKSGDAVPVPVKKEQKGKK